uniref:Uncharacterized protein n=1 Tax=viral metagenome TaxID=1070528 RepID=A0A6M3KUJ5_9ZZZZ
MAFVDSQTGGIIDYGAGESEIKLATAAKVGDAIGWSSGWVRALATTGTAIQMRCVAAQDGASGQKIKAYFGKVLLGGTRISGGTAGSALYVAEGTSNGKYTETAPTDTGDCDTVVGYMFSTTEAILIPGRNTDSVA